MVTYYRKLCPLLLGTYNLLDACYLHCAKDRLLSACAINRVHDGGERLSENHGTKSTQYTWWSLWSRTKKSYTGFPASIHVSHNSYSSRPYDRKTRPSKISLVQRVEPRISPWVYNAGCECRLRVTVSLRRIESSDFTLILARWTCLKIYCTLMPAAPVHVGCGFHCISYLAHILY